MSNATESPSSQGAPSSGWHAAHGLLYILLTAAALCVPWCRYWPWIWVVPLATYGMLVTLIRPLRESFRPFRIGTINGRLLLATGVVIVGSSTALLIFDHLVRPDVKHFREYIRTTGVLDLIVTWVLFSIVNAILEELAFRGVLFDSMQPQLGTWGALSLTSILFGLGHLGGYPPGPIGAIMSGVYALFLGGLRIWSGGLALPVLAHIAADATIFAIVIRSPAPQ